MCKPFLIRSWADPTRQYELNDYGKFRDLYYPGYYVAGGTVPDLPEGQEWENDELAEWLKPHVAPAAVPDAAPAPPTLADHEV